MKKNLLLALAGLFIIATTHAQVKTRTLKKVAELLMPKTVDDDMPGTRGASVVWHPVQKKYYAVMAGNAGYPIAAFDAAGKRLSGKNDEALNDVRGLWYNPVSKRIEGNTYSDNGWFFYKLNSLGMIESSEILFEDQNQPNEQCVGAYDPDTKQVLFLDGSQVYSYSIADGAASESKLVLHWGRAEKDGPDEEEGPTEPSEYHNTSTVVFTGVAGAEIGALNTDIKQIELYSKKIGFMTQVLKLPDTATAETIFNFAFANGIYWLFDMEKRIWTGYK
jgi:hypothetical protein